MSKTAIMPLDDYKNACDKIRFLEQASGEIKSGELAGRIEQLYGVAFDEGYESGYPIGVEDGKKAEYDALWNGIQNFGNRSNYYYGFSRWTAEYIRPKYKVTPTAVKGVVYMFYACTRLLKVEKDYFDFSQKESGADGGYFYTFSNCTSLQEIEDIGFQANPSTAAQYQHAFSYCTNLHTIAKIRSDENTTYSNTFVRCDNLQNITFEGVIGVNISFSDCVKLSENSIRNIIGCLSDSKERTLTLSKTAVNKAFETSEGAKDGSTSSEWLNLIATKPTWNFSLV